jgi:transposase
MMKITLSDQERQPLEEIFTTTLDRRLRVRCQAILMASRGRRHRHIAEDLKISVRTLQRWLHAYQASTLKHRVHSLIQASKKQTRLSAA